MQKLASAKNKKAVNIFLLLSGLVFILIVKCIEHFQMVLFFEGAIIDYYTYIVYKNCVLFGLLISGVGVLLFLTNKITRLIFLLVYVLGIITIVITKNIRIPAENYKLFDISFNRKYTDKELIAYLEKNGIIQIKYRFGNKVIRIKNYMRYVKR